MLRFARRVVDQQSARQLTLINRWIAAEERRERERRQGEETRPPQPEWLIQHGLNHSNIDAVHTGDCWAAAKSGRCRPATRAQALDALRQQIAACVARHRAQHPRLGRPSCSCASGKAARSALEVRSQARARGTGRPADWPAPRGAGQRAPRPTPRRPRGGCRARRATAPRPARSGDRDARRCAPPSRCAPPPHALTSTAV
ncbi:DUF6233 domain-containing protein [Streptomyces collinus]|uniref:DUF6233 domain-containing protein n=1 Tax=Streptomyces collinus TaxID=42684 RepID=UPI0036E4BB51